MMPAQDPDSISIVPAESLPPEVFACPESIDLIITLCCVLSCYDYTICLDYDCIVVIVGVCGRAVVEAESDDAAFVTKLVAFIKL